jgi:hypothetical protein
MKLRNFLSILFLLAGLVSYGQVSNTMVFSSGQPECSGTLILDSLGSFYKASNCRGVSSVSFGTYQITNGIINFKFRRFDTYSPVLRVEESPATDETRIKVSVYTRFNTPVHTGFIIDATQMGTNSYTRFTTDGNGDIYINPSKYKSLRLNELNKFYSNWTFVDVKPKNLKIFINFPTEFFYAQHPTLVTGQDFSLQLKNNQLYDLSGKLYEPSKE